MFDKLRNLVCIGPLNRDVQPSLDPYFLEDEFEPLKAIKSMIESSIGLKTWKCYKLKHLCYAQCFSHLFGNLQSSTE